MVRIQKFFVATLLLSSWSIPDTTTSEVFQKKLSPQPKIAIIGAGVGGAGVAYFLRELVSHGYFVDVYEKSEAIGGRLQTVDINGKNYETGGAIIHPRNHYAKELVEKLNLRTRQDRSSTTFALLRGGNIVLSTSHWRIITILRILWRYGLGFNHLQAFVDKLIDDFTRIYALQSHGNSYNDPSAMLNAMSPHLANLTQYRFRGELKRLGLKDVLIDELVQAVTFVNYGQNTSVQAFVGMIGVAGADDGLWSVEDGNKQLPIHMVKASGANLLLNSLVSSIVDFHNGSYGVRFTLSSQPEEPVLKSYDIVVIASPLEVNQLKFENFTKLPYDAGARHYHRTVATIVAGNLRDNFTMTEMNVDTLFTCDRETFFTTISRIFPVDSESGDEESSSDSNEYPVYKIFSPEPLTESQLNTLFSSVAKVKTADWYAYPEYDRVPEVLPSFILSNDLYYLNAIEWAASAIEMSLISAKNIAILVADHLRTIVPLTEEAHASQLDRNEL